MDPEALIPEGTGPTVPGPWGTYRRQHARRPGSGDGAWGWGRASYGEAWMGVPPTAAGGL